MKKAIFLSFAAVLLIACLNLNLFIASHRHYSLYRVIQKEPRIPYQIEIRSPEYFSQFTDRKGWQVAPTRSEQPSRVFDKILDQLKWPKTIKSLSAFYTTDTNDIGLLKWMAHPSSTALPCMQEMAFRKKVGGVIYIDTQATMGIEILSASMVTFILETDTGLEEWLLVNDAAFEKITNKQNSR